MPTYTIDQIFSVRERFCDPPYPGFSLEEVVRRKRQQQGRQALTRGANAWHSQSAATAEEGVARLVRGELNKIAPEKYEEVLKGLLQEHFFNDEKSVETVVKVFYRKVVDEPGYSEMYASLVSDLSRFESTMRATRNGSSPAQEPSHLRRAILKRAQEEFDNATIERVENEMDDEELYFKRQKLLRRKKANIKFVGALYMRKVMQESTMLSIVNKLVFGTIPEKGKDLKIPSEVDVEVLVELFETIGARIDDGHNETNIDAVFQRLEQLLDLKKKGTNERVFPPRIKFRILDVIEMRDNNWTKRVTRADEQAPTTLGEMNKRMLSEKMGKPSSTSGSNATPTTMRRANTNNQGSRFPSSSDGSPSSPTAVTQQQPRAAPSSWRSLVAPDASPNAVAKADSSAFPSSPQPAATNQREMFGQKSNSKERGGKQSSSNSPSTIQKDPVAATPAPKAPVNPWTRGTPVAGSSSTEANKDASPSSTVATCGSTTVAPSPTAPVVVAPAAPATPVVSRGLQNYLKKRIKELQTTWIADSLNLLEQDDDVSIDKWEELLTLPPATATPSMSIALNRELAAAAADIKALPVHILHHEVVSVVAFEACATTKKDAQYHGCSFLIHGLGLDDEDLLKGLARVLQEAVEQGIAEDTPLFFKRFATMLVMMAGRTEEELAIHGCRVLCDAFRSILNAYALQDAADTATSPEDKAQFAEEFKEEAKHALLSVWDHLAVPPPLTLHTLSSVLASRNGDAVTDSLLVVLLESLVNRGGLEKETIVQWTNGPEGVSAQGLVIALQAARLA